MRVLIIEDNPDIADTIEQTLRNKLLTKPDASDEEAELGAVEEGVLEEA